ncbi:hypothetical protein [Lacinutrix sp. MedPE-SW]|uniref:hypothetical protein n=1 Tax=Lacinutrix sp. MedPE-SW TaxID=1860087 RepID=UPI000922EEF7|nr:hypothetical protein [Lacinutrix sp. MedPE-SW]OIQ22300.1 MAG: hypothetical protein BM549_07345 [Lacinutrix sp. MedPE-SW]
MKKLNKVVILLCLALAVLNCSSDDDNNSIVDNAVTNKITVGDSDFEMNTAIVEPTLNNSVFLSLTNKTQAQIEASYSGTTLNNVDYFTARINHSDLTSNVTYDLTEISNLEFIVDGDVINSEYENGFSQFYKSGSDENLEVTQGSIMVTNYSVDNLTLSFTFLRHDGTQISGSYNGTFLPLDDLE